MVADDLICIPIGSVSHVEEAKKNLVKDVYRFDRLGVLDWKILKMVVLWSIITTNHLLWLS